MKRPVVCRSQRRVVLSWLRSNGAAIPGRHDVGLFRGDSPAPLIGELGKIARAVVHVGEARGGRRTVSREAAESVPSTPRNLRGDERIEGQAEATPRPRSAVRHS